MWTVTVSPAAFSDEKLASLSVEVPQNLRSVAEVGLLVSLWCGRVHDSVTIGSAVCSFTFGFLAGEVAIKTSGGHISNKERLSLKAGQVDVAYLEHDNQTKHGTLGGKLGAGLSAIIGIPASLKAGGELSKRVLKSQKKKDTYHHSHWRVADAGHNFWRVSGIHLNQDNVLENKILGDEPLCYVATNDNSDSITVEVIYRCDLKDLWFVPEESFPKRRDMRFSLESEERNRQAVASRVIARALNKNTKNGRQLILARQKLSAVREQENSAVTHGQAQKK